MLDDRVRESICSGDMCYGNFTIIEVPGKRNDAGVCKLIQKWHNSKSAGECGGEGRLAEAIGAGDLAVEFGF